MPIFMVADRHRCLGFAQTCAAKMSKKDVKIVKGP